MLAMFVAVAQWELKVLMYYVAFFLNNVIEMVTVTKIAWPKPICMVTNVFTTQDDFCGLIQKEVVGCEIVRL